MILDEIVKKTKERVEENKKNLSLEKLREEVLAINHNNDEYVFLKAIRDKEITFICEVKKASPSKGIIADPFLYKEIALAYEAAGAGAISVLTEPYFFKGCEHYLTEIKQIVKIPVLRKDFIVDEYMIYEAKKIGADAILLICAILEKSQLKEYIELAEGLGLSVLVEVHDESEILMAIEAGAKIIGVNNRDLRDFTVDIQNSIRLKKLVSPDILFVSESGIKTHDDIEILKESGINAVLIGETLMKSDDKKAMLGVLMGKDKR